jgi:hypothetical protein
MVSKFNQHGSAMARRRRVAVVSVAGSGSQRASMAGCEETLAS